MGTSMLVAVDVALALLFTLRLTRLVTTDSIGQWWLYGPLYKRVNRPGRKTKWAKYVEGLVCPYCVGFWLGALVLLSLYVAGGPGNHSTVVEVWRWVAGVFALNWVVGYVASRTD